MEILTMATQTKKSRVNELNDKILEFEEASISAGAEIDQTDGSRIGLQYTLDTVREILADAYGDSFTDDVNEFLDNDDTNDGEFDSDDDDDGIEY